MARLGRKFLSDSLVLINGFSHEKVTPTQNQKKPHSLGNGPAKIGLSMIRGSRSTLRIFGHNQSSNPFLDDEAQETRPNGETRVPAQLLIRSTRSSNVHVELNSYLFEVGSNSLPSSLFALSPCFESSQYLQFGF